MKISICLVLAFTCLMSAVTGQFNNGVPERQTRDRPRTYCGDELGEVLMLVCQPSRGKRHTMSEPSKQMSKYRPSIIDDEDKWAANWEPREDFYNRINSLRVCILRILLSRIQKSARSKSVTRAFKNISRAYKSPKKSAAVK